MRGSGKQEDEVHAGERAFRALVTASSQVLYRMSPDWSEMRQLGGGGFISDSTEPTRFWLDAYIPNDAQAEVRRAIDEAIRTKGVFDLEHQVLRADGTIGWTHSQAVPLLGEDGEITEWFGAATDVTQRKLAERELQAALQEREALLKEIHHRVKNNLEVIDSLLHLQADALPEPRLRAALEETSRRIHAIAAIHRLLYESPDLAHVDVKEYAGRLFRSLSAVYLGESQRVRCAIEGASLHLDLRRAIPLGLVLNELISNAFKHAFPNARTGTVTLVLRCPAPFIEVQVTDDGVGFPQAKATGSLGLELVRILTEQLNGTLRFEASGGTSALLRFPAQPSGDN